MTAPLTPTTASDAEVSAEWRAAMEGVPVGPWAAYMDRYEVRVAATFIPEQEIIAMCATGRAAGKRSAWIARCSPSGIASLLDRLDKLSAEVAAKDAENALLSQRTLAAETLLEIVAGEKRAAETEAAGLRKAFQLLISDCTYHLEKYRPGPLAAARACLSPAKKEG